MPRWQPRGNRLAFESLESRCLLAGEVACQTDLADEIVSETPVPPDFTPVFSLVDLSAAGEVRKASATGSVGLLDQVDLFRVRVSQESAVSLQLDGLRADADLYLYDPSGRLSSQSRKAGSQPEVIDERLSPGTYLVAVRPNGLAWTAYRLAVTMQPLPAEISPPSGLPVSTDGPSTAPKQPVSSPQSEPHSADAVAPFPDVAYYGGSHDWNLNTINAPESWARGYTGQDVVVAVVDTGVDLSHGELSSSIWRNVDEIAADGIDNDGNGYVDDVGGWNFVENSNNVNDDNGHGTHVAGTIVAARNGIGTTGVAYDAEVMPVRVLSDDGRGTSWSLAAGIRYAVDNGADIINLSLGGGYSESIESAIRYAADNGVFVVAAAGNEGSDSPSHPAIASGHSPVLSVGAFTSSGALADFSNRVGNSGAIQVDAPGARITSTVPGGQFAVYSGTSMAAPHVAGIAALALSANPQLSPTQLRTLIVQNTAFAIAGSDSIGAVNAAVTVAYAAANVRLAADLGGSAVTASQSSPARLAEGWASISSANPPVADVALVAVDDGRGVQDADGRQTRAMVGDTALLHGAADSRTAPDRWRHRVNLVAIHRIVDHVIERTNLAPLDDYLDDIVAPA